MMHPEWLFRVLWIVATVCVVILFAAHSLRP